MTPKGYAKHIKSGKFYFLFTKYTQDGKTSFSTMADKDGEPSGGFRNIDSVNLKVICFEA